MAGRGASDQQLSQSAGSRWSGEDLRLKVPMMTEWRGSAVWPTAVTKHQRVAGVAYNEPYLTRVRGRMRNVVTRTLVSLGALVMTVSLAGCFGLPPLLSDEPDIEVSSEAPTIDEEQERAFFDNLAVFRQMAAKSDDFPASWRAIPVASWEEADTETRDMLVELGLENCQASIDSEPSSSDAALGAGQFVPWLSATYLCPDRLPEVERVFVAGVGEDTLQALELSQLHGDAHTDDVLTALTLCDAALVLSWKLPEGMDTGYFCWAMRINAITENDRDSDFTGMFLGEDDTSSDFDALAAEMGATPGGLGGLLDGAEG